MLLSSFTEHHIVTHAVASKSGQISLQFCQEMERESRWYTQMTKCLADTRGHQVPGLTYCTASDAVVLQTAEDAAPLYKRMEANLWIACQCTMIVKMLSSDLYDIALGSESRIPFLCYL